MKILKDSSLYVAGEIVAKVFPFLLLPYLTRALGAEEYGQLSYLMTIVILVNIFISF
ncbi:TPA: oligosaccharide flippase family protein, partial [Escherichia coli]|nr:oligosaccharide flippase family protein [Escherichia coli]